MLTEKKCSKCGDLKSAGEFYRDASSASGLDSCCRDCRRAYARSRPKRDSPSVESKICSHCCQVKASCEFGKNARESTGLQPWCRACHSAYVNNKPKVDAPVVSEKRCSKCGVVKMAGEFCKDKYKPSGLRSWCRQCRNLARAATRNDSPRVLTQKCRGCGEVKPAGDFPKCKENASGLKSLCQACGNAAAVTGHDEIMPGESGGIPRGGLKRKASANVDSGDSLVGVRKLKTRVPSVASESPRRAGMRSVDSPFAFSVPTKRRSPRKGSPRKCSISPTSQWNNNGGGIWPQVSDPWSAAWVGQDGMQVPGPMTVVPDSAFSEGFFAPSPFNVAMEEVKLEPVSPGPVQPPVCETSSPPGIWIEALSAGVPYPIFVPGSVEFPMVGNQFMPCVQLVLADGKPEAPEFPEPVSVAQNATQPFRCGLEVLAEAAEMVTSAPIGGEVSHH